MTDPVAYEVTPQQIVTRHDEECKGLSVSVESSNNIQFRASPTQLVANIKVYLYAKPGDSYQKLSETRPTLGMQMQPKYYPFLH